VGWLGIECPRINFPYLDNAGFKKFHVSPRCIDAGHHSSLHMQHPIRLRSRKNTCGFPNRFRSRRRVGRGI